MTHMPDYSSISDEALNRHIEELSDDDMKGLFSRGVIHNMMQRTKLLDYVITPATGGAISSFDIRPSS